MSRFGSSGFGGGGGGGGGFFSSGRFNEYQGPSSDNFGGSGGFFPGGSGLGGGGGADPNTSAVDSGAKGSGRSPEVVPVTISEINKCSDLKQDRIKIGNVEVNRITLVAQVRECKPLTSYVSFLLDDKTGSTIEAKLWGDSQEELARCAVSVGQYVRLYGSIKSLGDNVSISAFSIQPVRDINEVFFHMLDVVHSHAVLDKIAKGEMVVNGATGGTALMSQPQQGFVTSVPGMLDLQGDMGGAGGQATPQGLPADQQAVYAYLRGCGGEGDIREMYKVLRQFKQKDLERAVEALSGEGHIFSTVDDFTYRLVDSE
ncbi:replication protein A 32 kDa subunit-A-like [Paramacrobiotus metropolitanus]|uniref:replication protein A 32 kDa subunit-A-like n=1 Tax=Paramacrobiotus metropolitanus TaxID=2943436 RepID=UPI0024458071|nr:replication protein A 32 kDa subunit-A-like [Paramacrobiotus metropolitanus]